METPRDTTQAEPNIRKRYEDLLAHGYANIEAHMQLLWELSSPASLSPTGGAGTGKSGLDPLGPDGEARVLAGPDLNVLFYMGSRDWREKAKDDPKLRKSQFFWNVLQERPDIFVDNPGFAPGAYRQFRSPLAILREAGVVERHPSIPGRWILAA